MVYDEIGNPTTYLGKTLEWRYGRRLMGITDSSNVIGYKYAAGGERLSKTVNGLTTTYITLGGSILQEKNNGYELNYYYDSNGMLVSLGYKAAGASLETYYFVTRNLQGDILAIYKSKNSALVGTYLYDSWGKVVGINLASVSSDPNGIMEKNPFRYRGYYYDKETGFYYLKSRYYDPEAKRFINADGLVSTGTGVKGYNMYAYCENNPVNRSDPSGMCSYTFMTMIKMDCGSSMCKSSKSYNPPRGPMYSSPSPPPPSGPMWSTPAPNSGGQVQSPGVQTPQNPVPDSTVGSRGIHNNAIDLIASEGTTINAPVGGTIGTIHNPHPNNYNIYPYDPDVGGCKAGNYLTIITWDRSTLLLCHILNEGIGVKEGDTVYPGSPLALVGNTGNSSTAHLHIGVISGDKSILDYLPKNIMG